VIHHAFIGSGEFLVVALVGLLVFGRQLPQVMREVGKVWYGFRRTLNDLKRETGFDEAMRDIRREAQVDFNVADLKREMDPFAGPAKKDSPEDAVLDPGPAGKRTPAATVAQEEPAAEDEPDATGEAAAEDAAEPQAEKDPPAS